MYDPLLCVFSRIGSSPWLGIWLPVALARSSVSATTSFVARLEFPSSFCFTAYYYHIIIYV